MIHFSTLSVFQAFKFFTKRQNSGLVQIESICRRQHKCDSKTEICSGKGKKNVGKGQNVGFQHFLPFPEMFFRKSYSMSLKVGIVQ